ncbi:hypothetical protein [Bacillus massiliigorillae]|uniref:hypothetical protein n=1 Tax=Bacillus massiliigorillae TaxID=1243664 RepID=UPI0003A29B80|nr:hypothetical protein [Bacillus massiliigorillae]
MEGILLIGSFGATMITLGLLDNAGFKINNSFLSFTMECAKFGGLLYIIKLASTLFL